LLGATSCSLTIAPLLLQFACELRLWFARAMDEERSPLIDIVGDESEVPQAEVSATNSSSED
jgi:hypothetical protein